MKLLAPFAIPPLSGLFLVGTVFSAAAIMKDRWLVTLKRPDRPAVTCRASSDETIFVDNYQPSDLNRGGFTVFVHNMPVEVPADKVVRGSKINPTGHGVLFLITTKNNDDNPEIPACFVPAK